MLHISTIALTVILAGLFTSKELIEAGQLLFFISTLKCIYDNYKNRTLALPKSAYWMLGLLAISLVSIWVNSGDIPHPSNNRDKLKFPLMGVLGIYFFRYWLSTASDQVKKWVLNIFFASVIFSSAYGIFIFFSKDQSRLFGLLHTSKQAYCSSFFLILTLSALLFRDKLRHFLNSPIALVTLLITFFAMLLTFSRAPMLSFLSAIPLALFFYKKKLAYITGSISVLIALTFVGYYLYGKTNTGYRFLITKENGSDSERKAIWKAAVIAIKERPIFGWGYFNFKKQLPRIKKEHNLDAIKLHETHAHNNFLEITADTGFLGLIVFLGWLFYWIKETFSHTWGRRIFVPFGMVFLMTSQVDVSIIDSHMSTFIYLIYAFSSVLYERENIKQLF